MSEAIAEVEGLLAGRVGLRLDPTLRSKISRCIEEEAAAAGMGFAEYALHVVADQGAFQRLLNGITVQQTSFFRDAAVFEAIATSVLPGLREPVVAWSAGCANGQEAYSLAMLFAESRIRDWTVIATDISTRALVRAREASYSELEVAGLDERRRALYMQRSGARWEVRPALRERVRFVHHNLMGDLAPLPSARCQVVLCRNVLIYFSAPQLLAVLDRLASCLDPAGYLFLGGSESLWQLSDRFHLTRVGQAYAYRLGQRTVERRQVQAPVRAERRRPQTVADLLAAGEAAAEAGDFTAGAEHFRRAALTDPDHPIPYFQLGLCLERSGRMDAAHQAMRQARAAFERCDTARLEAMLEGYRPEELMRAVELRLESYR